MRLPTPYARLSRGPRALRFYLGDSVDLLAGLPPASVDVVVTSPPYNLGIAYRSYDDGRPRPEYLAWTGDWVAGAARVLGRRGSLFLNVGAKPTEPWTALDVAQAARPHLQLQNLIHWIKSITIDADAAGARSGLTDDLSVGHDKPINSNRFLHDCQEFVFHFSHDARTPLDRLALGVKYQDASNVARWQHAGSGVRCRGNAWFIRMKPFRAGIGNDRIGHVSTPAARVLHPLARAFAGAGRTGPVPGPWQYRGRRRAARRRIHRHRSRRALPARSDRPHQSGARMMILVSGT